MASIISLDDSNGHPQFVGNIGYKVAAQFFHLIGLKDKLFQVTAQGIQGAAQISHFILPVYDNLQGVIAGSEWPWRCFSCLQGDAQGAA